MKRLAHRFRTLPIRARLAMLVAAAVAFAVAAVSVTCWFIVQGKLYDQLDSDLAKNLRMPENQISLALNNCSSTPQQTGYPFRNYSQVVKEDGSVCLLQDSSAAIRIARSDKAQIKSGNFGRGYYRNGTTTDGTDVRVLVKPLATRTPDGESGPNVGLVVAVSLHGTQNTLNGLALVLLVVSGIGVI